MIINRNELLKALEMVRPGLASKEIIDQANTFAFLDGFVVTYNDEISIRQPVNLDITGAVNADELYKILNKRKEDEIDITANENELLITTFKELKNGEKREKLKAGLRFQSEITLPIEEIDDNGWKSLPDDFTKALKFVLFTCSKDMNKPILTCVHIRKDGYVESTDTYRLTRIKISDKLPIQTLIPNNVVRHLINYAINKVKLTDGWCHFKTEECTIFSCRVYSEEYPLTDDHYEVDGKSITLPSDLKAALETSKVFSKSGLEEDNLEITLENNNMKLRSENDNGSWSEENIRLRYKDEPISFSTHPMALEQIIDKTSECMITDRVIKFQGENWEHIVGLTG